MVENQKYKNFLIVDQHERQIIINAPCLFYDQERASILRIILMKWSAIECVEVGSGNNSVLINFDPSVLEKKDLLNLLDNVLANFSEKPRAKKEKSTGFEEKLHGHVLREFAFHIEGMSCSSCALFLEMLLSRNEDIVSASIDYSTKNGLVIGFLNEQDVINIIEEHGYKAHGINK